MLPMLEEHRAEIVWLCRRHSVKRLRLFGSAARGEFDPGRSDLDFFVEFQESGYAGLSDRYFGLLHGLEDVFKCRIDLVDRSVMQSRIFLEVSQQHLEELYNDATSAQAS